MLICEITRASVDDYKRFGGMTGRRWVVKPTEVHEINGMKLALQRAGGDAGYAELRDADDRPLAQIHLTPGNRFGVKAMMVNAVESLTPGAGNGRKLYAALLDSGIVLTGSVNQTPHSRAVWSWLAGDERYAVFGTDGRGEWDFAMPGSDEPFMDDGEIYDAGFRSWTIFAARRDIAIDTVQRMRSSAGR